MPTRERSEPAQDQKPVQDWQRLLQDIMQQRETLQSQLAWVHVVGAGVPELVGAPVTRPGLSDRLFAQQLLKNSELMEELVRMSHQGKDQSTQAPASDVFNFESEDFDGLEALRAMSQEMADAHARVAVVNEDTRRFLESRKLKVR